MRDVAIIGGGLAGLISAIQLAKAGLDVVLFEKKSYPYHKVCGEYISNEVLPFLKSIDAYPEQFSPSNLQYLELSSPSGNTLRTDLGLGGFGISRYNFDHFLAQKARAAGAEIADNSTVTKIGFRDDHFRLEILNGEPVEARIAIGAFGKRTNIDRILDRDFFRKVSPYLGVKYHMHLDFPEGLIALHNFRDGYCGVVKIEDEKVNVCYLVKNRQLKKYGSIKAMEEAVLAQNPHLRDIFSKGEKIYEQPEVINEISFSNKSIVDGHILMVGDAAGMITPLCGNGMAMAIHAGKMVSEEVLAYFLEHNNRKKLEVDHERNWRKNLGSRLATGRYIQALFGKPYISGSVIRLSKPFPALTKRVISLTHGKEF